jgi:DNA-binding response OmpR family regulator
MSIRIHPSSVLVVHSDLAISDLIRFTVERLGHHPIVYRNFASVLAGEHTDELDLLITDVMTVSPCGATTCWALFSDERLLTAPKIVVTARAFDPALSDAMSACGLKGILRVPFSPRELCHMVTEILEPDPLSLPSGSLPSGCR